MDGKLYCTLGCPDLAAAYFSDGLDEADRARVGQTPALETRTDWRVSRALKQRSVRKVRSLSHSKGRAAVLAGAADMPCGVDIEMMRMRDFAALADWVADADERAYLAERGWQTADFYCLWCCKEALLKASGLSFPADMRRVGWAFDRADGIALRAPEGGWCGLTAQYAGMMLAAVWQGEAECVFCLQTAEGVRNLPLEQAVFYGVRENV